MVITLEMLGQRIQHYRALRGWTKTELGERIGLSHASIVRLEKGQQNIPVQLFFDLATALDVTPWQLLGDEEKLEMPWYVTPAIRDLVCAVLHLNDTAIAHLTAFVQTVQRPSETA